MINSLLIALVAVIVVCPQCFADESPSVRKGIVEGQTLYTIEKERLVALPLSLANPPTISNAIWEPGRYTRNLQFGWDIEKGDLYAIPLNPPGALTTYAGLVVIPIAYCLADERAREGGGHRLVIPERFERYRIDPIGIALIGSQGRGAGGSTPPVLVDLCASKDAPPIAGTWIPGKLAVWQRLGGPEPKTVHWDTVAAASIPEREPFVLFGRADSLHILTASRKRFAVQGGQLVPEPKSPVSDPDVKDEGKMLVIDKDSDPPTAIVVRMSDEPASVSGERLRKIATAAAALMRHLALMPAEERQRR